MQALVERALSGCSTSCSQSVHVSWRALTERSRSCQNRGATVGVAASRSPRSGSGKGTTPPPRGQTRKKSGPEVKGKSPPKTKSSTPPAKPPRTSNSRPATMQPSSGSSAPGTATSKLPRPAGYVASSTASASAGSQWKAAAATAAAAVAASATASNVGGGSIPRGGVVQGTAAPAATSPGVDRVKSAIDVPDREAAVDGDGFLDLDGDGIDNDDESEAKNPPKDAPGEEDEEDEEDEEAFPEIKIVLPNPSNVKVKTAEYLQSCVSVSECPAPRFPEFAVIGRSNVGKSSIINMLTGRKDLALVSKQPGKTKCINHFLINGSWYLVDLPGYGFAKVGVQNRQQFDIFTREYFKTRPNLAMVFMLVDASIPPQKIDLEYANWLTDNEVPFALVFTKADKRRKGVPTTASESNITAFKRALLRDLAFLPPSILTSSAKGLGRGEMLNFIAGLRILFEKSGRLQAIRQGML